MLNPTSYRVGLALALLSVACANRSNVDQVPVGKKVEITKSDGGVVEGQITEKDPDTVKVNTGHGTKDIEKKAIADVQVVDASTPVVLPKVAKFREYTMPAGTVLEVRVTAPLSSATNRPEDPVQGELLKPVVVDDVVVLPQGSEVRGIVTEAKESGKVKGLASLAVTLQSVTADDTSYDIDAHWARQAQPTKMEDAKKIGIGAGAGAAVGAIIGGGKGALIGAAIGGGGGTAVALNTRGKEVTLERGAELNATLAKDVDVRVRIK